MPNNAKSHTLLKVFNAACKHSTRLAGRSFATSGSLMGALWDRLNLSRSTSVLGSLGNTGVGSGPVPPWIFKHGRNIVDRGLKVLFSACFDIFRSFFRSPPWKRLNRAIQYFLLIFSIFFSLPPLENFLPTPLLGKGIIYLLYPSHRFGSTSGSKAISHCCIFSFRSDNLIVEIGSNVQIRPNHYCRCMI